MSDAWMPGAGQLRGADDGGPLQGGAPRAVWQVIGADPAEVSARSAAERLCELGRASHLTWNPRSGEIVQLIPILRAGRSLGGQEGLASAWPAGNEDPGAGPGPAGPDGASPLAGVNSEGRLCVQICVVGFAWDPFTGGPMTGLEHIMDWLDSWGVPRRWPAGRPAAWGREYAGCRNRRLWAAGGHFGASQVPGAAAAGPGSIEIERLTGRAAAPMAGILRPARGGQARALTRTG